MKRDQKPAPPAGATADAISAPPPAPPVVVAPEPVSDTSGPAATSETRAPASDAAAGASAPPIAAPPPAAAQSGAAPEPSPARTATAVPVPDGYLRDAQGRLVPVTLVRQEQLLEDALVRQLHERAVAMSAQLAAFKAACVGDIEAFLALLAESYGARPAGAKGNLTLATFDGTLRVQVAIGEQLAFGPELQVAKDLVDQCIHDWSAGARAELVAMVMGAFDVDKAGKLNVGRILGLRRLAIDDPRWKSAMEAIGNGVRVDGRKQYVRFYERKAEDEKLEQVPLDLASV